MLPILIMCILILAVSLACINPTKESNAQTEFIVTDANDSLSITVRDWNHYIVSFSEKDITEMLQQTSSLPENVNAWVDLSAQKIYAQPTDLKFNPVASCSFNFLANESDLIVKINKLKIGQLPIPIKIVNHFLSAPIPTSFSLNQYFNTPIPFDFNHVEISSGQLHIDCKLNNDKTAEIVNSLLEKISLPSEITTDDIFSNSLIPTELDHATGKIDNTLIDTVANRFLEKHLSQNVSTSPANYMVQSATLNMTNRTILLNGTWLGFPINPLIEFQPTYVNNAIQFDITNLTFGSKSSPPAIISFIKKLIGDIQFPLDLLPLPNYCQINNLDFNPTYLGFTYSLDIETFIEELNNNPEGYKEYVSFAKEMGDKRGQFAFTIPYHSIIQAMTTYTQIAETESEPYTITSIDLHEDGLFSLDLVAFDIPIVFQTKMNATSLNNRIDLSCQDINVTIDGYSTPPESINTIFPEAIHFDLPAIPLIDQYGFNLSNVIFEENGLRLVVTLDE